MAIFNRQKPTLEDILKLIDGLPEEDKPKLREHLEERHDEEQEAYTEKEEGEKLEKEGDKAEGEKAVEKADEEREEAQADAEKAEDDAEADKEYDKKEDDVAEDKNEAMDDEKKEDAHEARMVAMEETLGKLQEQVGHLLEAMDNNHTFGESGRPNPMDGDNGEWEGRHTRAYFGR